MHYSLDMEPAGSPKTPPTTATSRWEWLRHSWAQFLLIVLVCVLTYWPWPGSGGLFDSEAQRVLPGWTMYHGGDAFVPHLFDRPYARKPPGMPWAIAASAWLLGETEFAARSVSALSATLVAVLSFTFARRWMRRISPFAGLIAGLAQALLPLMWSPGSAAEIEMLHNLWAALAALCVVDLLLSHQSSRAASVIVALGISLGTAGMIVTKGPAALPVLGAAAVAGAILARRAPRCDTGSQRLRTVAAALSLLAGVCIAIAVLLHMRHRITLLPPELVVLQDPREFLWNTARLGNIALLPVVGWASALPASLSILLIFPHSLRMFTPRQDSLSSDALFLPARAIAWALLLSLAMYTMLGVSNSRYTMPAMGMLGPAFAALILMWCRHPDERQAARRRGFLVAAFICVLAGSLVTHAVLTRQRAQSSGLHAATSLAASITSRPPLTIWADGVIETRAEVPFYLARQLEAKGVAVHVRWWPILTSPAPVAAGDMYLLRHDGEMDEWAGLGTTAGPITASAALKKWTFVLADVSLSSADSVPTPVQRVQP